MAGKNNNNMSYGKDGFVIRKGHALPRVKEEMAKMRGNKQEEKPWP